MAETETILGDDDRSPGPPWSFLSTEGRGGEMNRNRPLLLLPLTSHGPP